MSEKQLKPEQKDAITIEKNLLVSANAGSGKTFVMLERVLYNIEKGGSVLDFLLITFTDAAASQMRTKLQKALIKRYNELDDFSKKQHLQRQISLLPQADISTIHTFCFKIIKKYFYILSLNAGLKIADEEEVYDLKEKAFQIALEKELKREDLNFLELLSSYDSKRNFGAIKQIVFEIFGFLQNEANPEKFKQKINDVYTKGIENSKLVSVINDYVCEIVGFWKNAFSSILTKAQNIGYEKLESACGELLRQLSLIKNENNFLQNHQVVFSIVLPKKPTKTTDEMKEELSEEFGSLKKKLQEDLARLKTKVYLSEDTNKLQENLLWCKQNVDLLLQLEEEFSHTFQKLKLERNLLDFSDLEHYALKVLQNDDVCAEISSRFKQIFVDEYQDVNDIQEELVTKICSSGQCTLFLVGDPKQSIYRFRNTKPEIMIDKLEKFSQNVGDKQAIILSHNFRSDENILNFVNFIFSKIMTSKTAKIDYEKTSMFKAGLSFEKPGLNAVEIDLVSAGREKKEKLHPQNVYSVREASYEQDELFYAKSEAKIIVDRITDLVNESYKIFDPEKGFRSVEYRDIAVLFRSRGEYVNEIVSELENSGVPVKAFSEDSVMEKYEVQVLFSYLKLLLTTDDDYALTSFLTSPVIGYLFEQLAKLRKNSTGSFSKVICENKLSSEKLEKAFYLIEMGRKKLTNSTIYEVLNWFIYETHYESLVLSMSDGNSRLANVKIYVNDFLNHSFNSSLVNYISFCESSENVKNTTQLSGDENAITIMTMHQSKGLEFPIVFLVDMAHKFNRDSQKGACLFSSSLGIGVQVFDRENRFKSSTLARSAIIIEENREEFAEQLRVLYVALTRAKNHLFILGKVDLQTLSNNMSNLQIEKKNNFLSLILSCLSSSQLEALSMGKESMLIKSLQDSNFAIRVYEPLKNETMCTKNGNITAKKAVYSDEILQNVDFIHQKTTQPQTGIALKNSVSRIMAEENNNEQVVLEPKRFVFSEHKASADEIGTAYHKAMEILPLDLNLEQEVTDFLHKNLESNVFNLIDCGKIFKCLKYLQTWTKDADKVIREGKFYLFVPYNEVVIDSDIKDKILIQGVVDFVAKKGDEAVLIDFKTTREKNDDRLREKYKIQMECYKKAVENALTCRVSSKILYSFFKDCAISFDK